MNFLLSTYSTLIISILLINIKTGVVELTIVTNSDDEYQAKICLGTPSDQCFNVIPDFNSPYTWINSKECIFIDETPKFDPNKSKTFKQYDTLKEFKVNNEYQIEGTVVEDSAEFPQFEITNWRFILIDKYLTHPTKGNYYEGMLGLGFAHTNEENYSFVHLLEKQGIIKNKIFTFETINDDNAKLTFGVVPQKIIDDYKHFGTCNLGLKEYDYDKEWSKINHTNEYDIHLKYNKPIWECVASSIYLSNGNVEQINYESPNNIEGINLDFNKDYTVVPFSFLFFLENTVFKSAISKGDCSFYKDFKKNFYSFKCVVNEPVFDYEFLNIEFEKWKIKLKISTQLFVRYGNEIYCRFVSNEGERNWYLGASLLQYFSIIFDMDNQVLGLYNETNIIYNNENEAVVPEYRTTLPDFVDPNKYKSIRKVGILVFVIILLCGIILLFRFIRRRILIFQYNVETEKIEEYMKMPKSK